MKLWVQLISRLKDKSQGFLKNFVDEKKGGRNKTEEVKEVLPFKPSKPKRALRNPKRVVKDPSSVTSHAQSDSSYSQ
jgi:hypothetical protein